MKPKTIAARLHRAGIVLGLDSNYCLIAGPASKLTPAQKKLIRAHCADLTAYLIDAYDQRGPTDKPSRQALSDLLVRLWRNALLPQNQSKGKP